MLYADVEICLGDYERVSASQMVTSDQKYRGRKLYCPLCKEPVSFVHGEIQSPHFRHKAGSLNAQNCELYSSNDFSYSGLIGTSNKEKTGIPSYIEKIGDKFQLSLGFPPISSNDFSSIKNIQQSIEIKNLTSQVITKIYSSNLHENQITYVPLEYIYHEYFLYYSEKNGLLKSIWGNQTLEIPRDGAFFDINEPYSKQISFNGKIFSDTEYYFVTPTNNRPNQPFIKIIEEHPLISYTYQKWVVYKLSITEVTAASCRFAETHRVRLVEPPTECLLVWPPLIQDGNRHITNDIGTIYCGLQAHNQFSTHEICIEDELNDRTEVVKVETRSPLFTTLCNGEKLRIFPKTIDENDNGIFIQYSLKSKTHAYRYPNMQLLWNGEEITDGAEIISPTNKDKLSFKSDIPCHIYHLHGLKTREIYWDTDHILSFSYIENGDTIRVLHGLDRMYAIRFKNAQSKKLMLSEDVISDEKMYNILTKPGSGYVPISSTLKYIASKIVMFPKSAEFIRKTMKIGKISNEAAEFLLKKYVLCDF